METVNFVPCSIRFNGFITTLNSEVRREVNIFLIAQTYDRNDRDRPTVTHYQQHSHRACGYYVYGLDI